MGKPGVNWEAAGKEWSRQQRPWRVPGGVRGPMLRWFHADHCSPNHALSSPRHQRAADRIDQRKRTSQFLTPLGNAHGSPLDYGHADEQSHTQSTLQAGT